MILIVDDSADELIIIKRAIIKARPDCVVEKAMDGPEAMLRLQNGTTPALVFLDLKLPGMDGIDILRSIRARETARYIPVVILTSSILESDVRDAYDAGASGFLHKTHDLAAFTENIKTAIHYWIDVNVSPS
jgi:two-component system response regulator